MPKSITEEERWLAEIRSGEERALEQIIERYTPYAGAIVWGIVGGTLTQNDAEEILSDVFLALWKNADKIRPGKLKAYLGAIARNRAKDALRKVRPTWELEEDELFFDTADPEQLLTEDEERQLLLRTLGELPEPEHTIFIRHYFLYQKTAEIAAALGMNVNTVQSRLKRGREKLRLALVKGGYTLE